jgi:Flp pilus assembly protein TadG
VNTESLVKDQRGAVLVEFVIAIVPVIIAFFSFLQLTQVATARLVLKHGAIVGARAAAVFSNEHENNPGQPEGTNAAPVTQGVKAAMLPWVQKGAFTNIHVDVEDASSEEDPYGWVTVRVDATYNCRAETGPFWDVLTCGADRKKEMSETYRMPHQGAVYE